MRNKLLGFVLVGAAIGATIAACGDGTTTGPTSCTSDSSCQTGEICHPTAKICVQSCTGATDCPDSAKNCDSLTVNGVTSGKFCQCSTTALCGQGNAGDICRAEDKICSAACTSDSECGSGRSCVDGDCKTTGGTDAGTDGGTGSCSWSTCSSTSFTSGAQMCNGSNCGAGPSCSGSDQSTCTYGSFCNGGACGYPPRPQSGNVGTNACQNFYTGSHSGGPQWNPSSSTGPVIYNVSEIGHGTGGVPVGGSTCSSGNFCECFDNQTEFKISLRAYRTDTNWPTTRNGFATSGPTLFYVNTAGTDRDVMANPRLLDPTTGYNTQSNPKDIEFQMWFCLDGTGVNAFQPGFYFQGGNEVCH